MAGPFQFVVRVSAQEEERGQHDELGAISTGHSETDDGEHGMEHLRLEDGEAARGDGAPWTDYDVLLSRRLVRRVEAEQVPPRPVTYTYKIGDG